MLNLIIWDWEHSIQEHVEKAESLSDHTVLFGMGGEMGNFWKYIFQTEIESKYWFSD